MLIPFLGRNINSSIMAVAAVFICLTVAGCNSAGNVTPNQAMIVSQVELPDALEETSGLACGANGLTTLNDSGNEPVLFQLQSDGTISRQQRISTTNHDWEALAADNDFFYIGDVGNNMGSRTDLMITKVARDSGEIMAKLPVTYASNEPGSNMPYMHDYDAEALAEKNDDLFLFSKSWDSGVVRVYQLSKTQPNLDLTPVARISGLPGVVTGAAYNASQKRFLLTGYQRSVLGVSNPFVATLLENWQVQNIFSLPELGQVEGICISPDNKVWVSQEGALHYAAKLVNIRIP